MSNLTTSPGEHIRRVRKRLGLTLNDVSSRTGLTVPTLSKIENGNVSLSYDKLLLLSRGLSVDMAELLTETPGEPDPPSGGGGSGRRVVQRAGEGQAVTTLSYRALYLATDLLNKRFTPIVVELHARTFEEFATEFGGLIRHTGEEFALVLEGEVTLLSEHYAPVVLRVGDSIFFDSGMGHAYLKAADTPCRIAVVCTLPNGQVNLQKPPPAASQGVRSPRKRPPAKPPATAFRSKKR